MLFTEPTFLFLFLPLLLAAHAVTPPRARNLLLVGASALFYAAGEHRFIVWLAASIAVNHVVALAIQATRGTRRARLWLAAGVTSDLLLLVVFKYLPLPGITLPLGISFFTFHKISYKVDVYRGVSEAQRSIVELALYILLFPQLIAGPIIRYHEIARELVRRHLTLSDFADGARRFICGLGKKMLVANSAAVAADAIFALPPAQLGAGLAWLGALAYAVHIYFDFSGYSDMAIGLGRMFGFHFPENFDYPYVATSVTDFWRRWHMSLTRWFRDYLYIPLGGNRLGARHTYANLLLVFFLCGLWHGAAWSFVGWGLFHGAFLVVERAGWGRVLAAAPRPARHVYTLLVVLVGWVLFRAPGLRAGLAYLEAMAGGGSGRYHDVGLYLDRSLAFWLVAGAIAATPIRKVLPRAEVAADVGLALVLGASLMAIAAGSYNPFIYFRF